MARELAPSGITVNTVAPGWIPTERHANDPRELKDEYLAHIPVRRWGTAQDVADAVLYLASEEASFVTGQTICVNGGLTPW
jgi:3-oxoacyl-[acyl-carrier protein] reductase